MVHETVLILPMEGAAAVLQTPYGEARLLRREDGAPPVLLREEGADARALIYAAKEMGAKRILAGEAVQAISPLLEPGDLVIPQDTVDLTKLRPFTFFVGKGYGFIKLNPPFCPDLMATLLKSGRVLQPRTFQGATYIAAEGPRDATDAEAKMFRQWGGDIVGSDLLPEAYLARELELHYAALTVIGGDAADLLGLLSAAAAQPHGQAACGCETTMAFMQAQGVVGKDWKSWLG